jgi:hypothetical protein
MNFFNRRDKSEPGQILVIVAVGLVVIVAMVGIVIDGGYAWGKQRETQNGSDSASEAGAVVLAENLVRAAQVPPVTAKTDCEVRAAVNSAAVANDIGPAPDAWYTDFDGNLLNAAGAVVTDTADAAEVGNAANAIPPGAMGVRVDGQQTFDTFLARVIGFNQFTTTTTATAHAGYLGGTCSAADGCIILPVTVPVTVLGCDGSNNPAPISPPVKWPAPSNVLSVPLCKNGPGNVGWIDWTPTGGGTSELVQAILHPSNIAMTWPGWYYITSTGNVNSATVENALNTYKGKDVMFPQFDATCDTEPSGPGIEDCPAANVGGHGSNQWYHVAGMSTFQFCTDDGSMPECTTAGGAPKNYAQGAYVNGNNKTVCDTGNGATSCLAGKFKVISYEGSVEAAPGTNQQTSTVSVQLIR